MRAGGAIWISRGGCGGNEALRRKVESLIDSHEKTGKFIDSPAYETAAESLVDEKAALKSGQSIESYEILSFRSFLNMPRRLEAFG